ncbi:MAG: hypothetical protein EBY76_04505 [Betaproteobacteria bacterium]|nr:hypothetical protein [Betaproteobacteria bacterium]
MSNSKPEFEEVSVSPSGASSSPRSTSLPRCTSSNAEVFPAPVSLRRVSQTKPACSPSTLKIKSPTLKPARAATLPATTPATLARVLRKIASARVFSKFATCSKA